VWFWACSRAIDAIRREARFQHDSLDAASAEALGGVALPDDELLDVARLHAELHRALMRIDAQPRQLVSLAFFRGLSHEEIAAQTAIPLGTVKSQIRRALIALRQILGEARAAALAA
jgi:RNA polymerase sigma-70 factor (ECF subfamily)